MTESDLPHRLADDLDTNFEGLVIVLQGTVCRFDYRWCGNAQDAFVWACSLHPAE